MIAATLEWRMNCTLKPPCDRYTMPLEEGRVYVIGRKSEDKERKVPDILFPNEHEYKGIARRNTGILVLDGKIYIDNYAAHTHSGTFLNNTCMPYTYRDKRDNSTHDWVQIEERQEVGIGSEGKELFFRIVLAETKSMEEEEKEKRSNSFRYDSLCELWNSKDTKITRIRDRESGEELILKRVDPKGNVSKRARLEREVQFGMEMDHKNLLKTYACLNQDPFEIVMEYCDGGTLRDLMQTEKEMNLYKATQIILPLLDALDYMHTYANYDYEHKNPYDHIIVHRDVKPENIMFKTEDGKKVLKLVDYGLVKDGYYDGESGVTGPGEILGTLSYMSRRQFLNSAMTSWHFDVFAAAAIYYELLSGKKIRPANINYKILYDRKSTWPRVPLSLALGNNPGVPLKLMELIDQVLAEEMMDSSYEFTTAAKLKSEIRRIVMDDPF